MPLITCSTATITNHTPSQTKRRRSTSELRVTGTPGAPPTPPTPFHSFCCSPSFFFFVGRKLMAEIDCRLVFCARLNYSEAGLKISIFSRTVYVSVLCCLWWGQFERALFVCSTAVHAALVFVSSFLFRISSCQHKKLIFTTVSEKKREQNILHSSGQNVDLTSTGGYDTILQYLNDGKRTCKEVEEFIKAR